MISRKFAFCDQSKFAMHSNILTGTIGALVIDTCQVPDASKLPIDLGHIARWRHPAPAGSNFGFPCKHSLEQARMGTGPTRLARSSQAIQKMRQCIYDVQIFLCPGPPSIESSAGCRSGANCTIPLSRAVSSFVSPYPLYLKAGDAGLQAAEVEVLLYSRRSVSCLGLLAIGKPNVGLTPGSLATAPLEFSRLHPESGQLKLFSDCLCIALSIFALSLASSGPNHQT